MLKQIATGLLPDSVVNRRKAYFPMPALKYVSGAYLEFMRELLTSDKARQRGLYQSAFIDKLLAEPESHFTRLQGSKLWHCAALELWFQQNVDR